MKFPLTELFFLEKNLEDSVSWRRTKDDCDGGTGWKGSWEMGVEEAGEEVPVGKMGTKWLVFLW